jgi:type I restriction enzyme S subunit
MSWPRVKLQAVCRIEKGITGINKAIPGIYPMVVTSEERKSNTEYQFDDDAVIIPLVSSTGHGHKSLKRIHFQQGKFALGSILCAVIPKDKSILSAEYLYRFLDLNKEHELVARMKGMANVTLPMKEIAQIEIAIPPMAQQIEFTKKYNQLENNSESISSEFTHQLDLLKKLRQQILQDAVQGKLVSQDSNDEPASVLLERIKAEKERLVQDKKIKKEKPLPAIKLEEVPFEIPENWVWCRLGDTILSAKDGPHFSPEYSFHGVPFISTRNISPDGIDFSTAKYISKEYHNQISKRCKPEKGDLLYTKGGTTGIAAVNTTDVEFNVWVHVAVLKGTNYINPFYLKNCLNSPHCYIQSQEMTRGISNQDLGLTRMVKITIPLPPLSEQNQIVAKIDQLMNLCDELEQSIKQNQTYTRQLLQVALKEALEPESRSQ